MLAKSHIWLRHSLGCQAKSDRNDAGSYQVGLVWYLANPPQPYEKWSVVNL